MFDFGRKSEPFLLEIHSSHVFSLFSPSWKRCKALPCSDVSTSTWQRPSQRYRPARACSVKQNLPQKRLGAVKIVAEALKANGVRSGLGEVNPRRMKADLDRSLAESLAAKLLRLLPRLQLIFGTKVAVQAILASRTTLTSSIQMRGAILTGAWLPIPCARLALEHF